MFPANHAEVLSPDWVPPVALGRQREVADVVRRLDPPRPIAPPPWIVGVAGPAGSGTSTVARRAAREVLDRWRQAGLPGTARTLAVRVAGLRGGHGVATALVQRLDEGFDGRGFGTREILAGLLRRIRREARPTVLVLDDLAAGSADIGAVLGAVGEPDRFLPEGQEELPPLWAVVAGTFEALVTVESQIDGRFSFAPFVTLTDCSEELLTQIVADRAARALGRPLPRATTLNIVHRALTEGGGAGRAIDLVRRTVFGASSSHEFGTSRRGAETSLVIEPRVVQAIETASRGVAARLSEVKRLEADLARAEGERPLPATTLWRRIVRLERVGYVRRQIRTGGNGGTVSLLRVLTPVEEWVTEDRPTGTPRGCGAWSDAAGGREDSTSAGPSELGSWGSSEGAPD